jgi:hypothetical protein
MEDGLIGSIMGHFGGHVSLGIDGRVLWLVLVITSGKWIIDRSVRVNNDVTRAQRDTAPPDASSPATPLPTQHIRG